jgi:hypothetical protein
VKAQVLHGLHLLAGQGAHLWPPGSVEAIVDVALNTPYQRVLSWSLDVLQVLAKSTATCHSQLHPGKDTEDFGIHCTEVCVPYLISFSKHVFVRRMVSSGMLCHVALVRTDVSEELSTSFIRVTRISELGTTLAVTSNRCTLQRNNKLLVTASIVPSSLILVILMMEALSSSETSVLTGATRCNILEDTILHSHCRENLKSYMCLFHQILSLLLIKSNYVFF